MTSSLDMASMTLRDLADAVTAGRLAYEQVALEYAARKRAGLDPDTGRPPVVVIDRSRCSPALGACPTCGRASGLPIANHEVP